AYAGALTLLTWQLPIPLALASGAVCAAAIAWPIGYLSTRRTGIYFAMLTLAFAQLLYTIAYKWRSLTGGSDGITGVPKSALWWNGPAIATPPASYLLVLTTVVLSLLACLPLVRSPFAKALASI